MSISFFNDLGGLLSHFGWLSLLRLLSRSPEVEHNPKPSIWLFWLERCGRWGSSPLTTLADHQTLNVIQKQAFYFSGWRGVGMGFKSINQPGWSSEVECNPKMSILMLLAGEGWQMGFKSINQPGQSSDVECNPKPSISFFWMEWGGRWVLSLLTSLADHQKLNIIKKWAFYFFGWRGVADGVQVHRPARPIIRSWM